ncbi:hypothetical protein GCM10023169_34840 [Georgenia halophila]|uniref:SnoaL-like domain-containing protein n=1 Tax=Georgenia halophila TaxID=620889 RepID=A0ABP8LME0_9MICO
MPSTDQETLDRLRTLETKVDELTSVQEIERVQQQYLRDLADRNWDGVADAYAEDAVCDIRNHGRHEGRENISAMLSAELQPVVKTRDAYMLSSPSIVVDGDKAYGEFVWHRFQCEFRTSFGMLRVWGPWSEGIYKVHYERVNGAWKIKDLWTRVIRPDSDDEIAAATDGRIGAGYTPVGQPAY